MQPCRSSRNDWIRLKPTSSRSLKSARQPMARLEGMGQLKEHLEEKTAEVKELSATLTELREKQAAHGNGHRKGANGGRRKTPIA